MPRLRQISRQDAHPTALRLYDMLFGDRDPVASPGTATGTPGNWWTVFAGVPDCFDHTVSGFAFYRSADRQLSPQLRELGQLRAGYARGSRFVALAGEERIVFDADPARSEDEPRHVQRKASVGDDAV